VNKLSAVEKELLCFSEAKPVVVDFAHMFLNSILVALVNIFNERIKVKLHRVLDWILIEDLGVKVSNLVDDRKTAFLDPSQDFLLRSTVFSCVFSLNLSASLNINGQTLACNARTLSLDDEVAFRPANSVGYVQRFLICLIQLEVFNTTQLAFATIQFSLKFAVYPS